MKNKTNKPNMYINKNNHIITIPSGQKKISDSCVITGDNNTPLCQIDLICFDAKTEAIQMAKFRQIITYLMENKII